MKKYIFLAVLLIIGGGIYYAVNSYEGIVKELVHKYGSEVTGTDVNMQGFKLSLTNGEAHISKITVANPKGYNATNFISLDGISVKVDLKSITTDTIVIDSVVINKPYISYEMLSLTQNNIKEIQNNVNKFAQSKKTASTTQAPKAEKTAKASEPGKKVIIKSLRINSGELQASASVAGKSNAVSVVLPDIQMNGIGEAKKGDNVSQIISKILTQILQTASQTVAKSQIADLQGVAQESLNNVVGTVRDRVKNNGIFAQ